MLQAGWSSFTELVRTYLIPEAAVKDPYHTDEALRGFDFPILIGHGVRDGVLPIAHARRLRRIAADPTYVEYDCGHGDFPGRGNREDWQRQIREFLLKCGVIKPAP